MLRGPWSASVATTGSPAAIASTTTLPNASRLEGRTKIEALPNSGVTGEVSPISRMLLDSPSSSMRARSFFFSAPWP